MPSKLEQPITSGPVYYEGGTRPIHGLTHNGGDESRPFHQINSAFDPPPYSGDQSRTRRSSGDGGMQNLTVPDDRNVYPQAPPVGPEAAGNLGRKPQHVECPWCHASVQTRVKRQLGYKNGIAAGVVAVLMWPLFWVPLVIPGLHRKIHYCPQCNRMIGRGHRKPQAQPQ
ncbi:hypothetical protein H4R18_002206 [Coemansia javaensis]|uniref:LITAF domain-containing protein n=1 Tax=Coemansia javaensis TaxID=2761396 RepID=A0A9W8HFU0_9FUNG|nr:hypothetical protein H4R18_002206 [Coemansia javaensis]